jgi:hypothetical protein
MAIQFSSAQYRGLATLIEAGAKRRLADEYDGAQARGEVRSHTLVATPIVYLGGPRCRVARTRPIFKNRFGLKSVLGSYLK